MWEIFRFDKWGLYCIAGLVTLIGCFLGGIAWLVHYIATLANTPNQIQALSPIDLAGVTATLGGLVLIGAFYKEKNESVEDSNINTALKNIGKTILFSSICFIIAYFLLEYVRIITSPTLSAIEYLFVVVSDIALILAILTLSLAASSLVTVMRFIR